MSAPKIFFKLINNKIFFLSTFPYIRDIYNEPKAWEVALERGVLKKIMNMNDMFRKI
jgi:hypothetical protein